MGKLRRKIMKKAVKYAFKAAKDSAGKAVLESVIIQGETPDAGGERHLKEISSGQAFRLTSPNPLVLVCTEKEDGSVNIAPVSFFMFTSFSPAMVAFALGENKNTGANFERTGRAVIVTPGLSLKEEVVKFGTSSGSKSDKLAENPVPMQELDGCGIKVPEDIRTAFIVELDGTMQTGNHTLYSCKVDKIYGDETRGALFAWKGYSLIDAAVRP